MSGAKPNKTYLNADDFLAGIMGKPVDYEVEDLGWVKVQPLEYVVVEKLYRKYEKDVMQLTFQAAVQGLVEPKLSEEQVRELQHAKAGVITTIAKRVMELSGMAEAKELEDLAGAGS